MSGVIFLILRFIIGHPSSPLGVTSGSVTSEGSFRGSDRFTKGVETLSKPNFFQVILNEVKNLELI